MLLMPSQQQQNPFAPSLARLLVAQLERGTVLFGSAGRTGDGMACSGSGDGHKRAHEIREFHTQGKGRSAGVQCACSMSFGCNTFPCLFRPKLHHHHPIQRTSCTSRPPPAGRTRPFLNRHQTLMADSHLYLLQVRLQSDPVNPACAFKPGYLSQLFLRCQWFYVLDPLRVLSLHIERLFV